MVNGVRERRRFDNIEDVWDVVNLIIEETEQANEKTGNNFDIGNSLINQIPFFACNNIFFDHNIQKDIEKYLYCEKFNVPPYKGAYEDQPAMWVRKTFAIKSAIAKKEKRDIDVARKNSNKI